MLWREIALSLALACLACAPTRPLPAPKAAPAPSDRLGYPRPLVPETAAGAASGASQLATPKFAGASPSLPSESALSSPPNSWVIDEPGPWKLEALSPTGSWVAYCVQQRDLYLAVAPTNGASPLPRRMDELLAWSSNGTRVVVRDEDHAILMDLGRKRELDLSVYSPDLTRDALPDHRSFAFSRDGNTLAFLSASPKPTLHWLDLKGEGTHEFAHQSVPLERVPWRVRLDASLAELDGASTEPWPVPHAKEVQLRCQRKPGVFSAYSKLSDPLARYKRSVMLVDLGRKQGPDPAPGFVMTLGNRWVRREPTGRLLLVDGPIQKQITSEKCGGRIRHTDAKRGLFVVTCEHFVPEPRETKASSDTKNNPKKKVETRFETFLVAPGYVQELTLTLPRIGFDRPPAPDPSARFIPLSDGTAVYVVDLSLRTAQLLSESSRFLTSAEDRALVVQGNHLAVYGPKSGSRGASLEEFGRDFDVLGPILVRGGFVHAKGKLYYPTRVPEPAPDRLIELTSLGATLSARGESGDSTWTGPLIVERARLNPLTLPPELVPRRNGSARLVP